jgi:hypothetical protein
MREVVGGQFFGEDDDDDYEDNFDHDFDDGDETSEEIVGGRESDLGEGKSDAQFSGLGLM